MEVTLNQLKDWGACAHGYKKVLEYVGLKYDKDAPIKLSATLKSNGVDDTLWCVERLTLTPEQEKDFQLLACNYAERVLPIFEKEQPNDSRVKNCIDVARRFALGSASAEELDAAWVAARAAGAARAAAGGSAKAAAGAAWDAAGGSAWDAARAAAKAAAWDAAWAARAAAWAAARAAAWDAAGDAAWAAARAAAWAAWAAEKAAQTEMLLGLLLKYECKEG